jgi:hypothetical protein
MPTVERIPLIDACGLPLKPTRSFSAAQVSDLAAAKLVEICGRRWVTAAKMLPGSSLSAINAHLRRKISSRLPQAEDNQTVELQGRTYQHCWRHCITYA